VKLSDHQRDELQEAMLSAFPEPQRLKEMVKLKLGKNLPEISSPNNTLDTVIFDLIELAKSEGWLEKLVTKAQEHNPGNVELKEFVAKINAGVDKNTLSACPYRGLLAFQEKDAEFFFGRDEFVQQLVDAVQKHSLVPVIGASGSGKSSVVLAGLIPRLREEGTWLIESFRPGNQPFYELAFALVCVRYPKLKPPPDKDKDTDEHKEERDQKIVKLFNEFNEQTRELWHEVREIRREHDSKKLLLIIDQFEELYAADSKEEKKFVDALLKAIENNPCLRVVLTIRHEFLDNITNNPDFKKKALDKGEGNPQYLGAMNPDEIKSVIELIDRRTHKKIVALEDGLTQQILDDVQEEPGNLSLLEFALTQLWEKSRGGELTLKAYGKIGSVKKALANYANEIYDKLSKEEKTQVQQIFVQLTRPGKKVDVAKEDKKQEQSRFLVKDTRQLATRAEIGEDNWRLVQQKLVGVDRDTPDQQKKLPLLVTGRNEKTGEQTVEVVHEALIREWKKLQEWINNDRAFLTWRYQLRTQIDQWNVDKDEGALLRGKPLVTAEDWLQKREADLTNERPYIEQSVLLRNSQERKIVMAKNINNAILCLGIVFCSVVLFLLKDSIILMFITANKKHLSKKNLEHFQLPKANLSEANLSGANLSRANLDGSDLARAKLQGAKLVNTFMPGAKLQDADLSQADLSGKDTNLHHSDLSRAKLQEANLVQTFMPGANLQDADLSQANLSGANIAGADLLGAKLQGAKLVNTFMPGAKLQDADLSQADLSGKDTNLEHSDLSRAKLQEANLVQTFMPGANLQYADLSQANLSGANIAGADLLGAKLQGANLVQTFMPGAKLQDADLSQANLSGANIDGADLLRANFQGTKSLKPDQVKRAKNWGQAKYDKDFREQLGLTASKEAKK